MKTCHICHVSKPFEDFAKDKSTRDGHQARCKACDRAYQQTRARRDYSNYVPSEQAKANRRTREAAYRAENKDRIAAHVREYRGNPEIRARYAAAAQEHRANNPDKYTARYKVSNAIAVGRLVPQPCERCGTEPTHGHHEDYSKPLDVNWLCRPCHVQRHKEIRRGY